MPSGPHVVAGEALLDLLLPFWQLLIAVCVVVVLGVSVHRLARRGRSRMTTALLVTGAAAVGLVAIGVLLR
jgi:predicted PurR-regulated permease PerM